MDHMNGTHIQGPADGHNRVIGLELRSSTGDTETRILGKKYVHMAIFPEGKEGCGTYLTPVQIIELIEELHLQLIAIRQGE